MTVGDFGKKVRPQNGKNGPKAGFFEFIKNEKIAFYRFDLYWQFMSVPAQIAYFGKSVSLDIGQNTLRQSDCRIFKSTISLESTDEIAWFFASLYKIYES